MIFFLPYEVLTFKMIFHFFFNF